MSHPAATLPAYLDEMTFRFNRRKNANLFLDTLDRSVAADVLLRQEPAEEEDQDEDEDEEDGNEDDDETNEDDDGYSE